MNVQKDRTTFQKVADRCKSKTITMEDFQTYEEAFPDNIDKTLAMMDDLIAQRNAQQEQSDESVL